MNQLTDSYSHYVTSQIGKKWDNAFAGASVGGAFALGAASQGLETNSAFTRRTIPTHDHYFFGSRWKAVSSGTGGSFPSFIVFWDNGSTQILIGRDVTGHLTILRGPTTLATSTLTVAIGAIVYIEVEAKIHPTAGVVNVWVNGTLYVTFSGNTRATANSFVTQLSLGTGGGGNVHWWSDTYLNDETGTTMNGRLGDVTIKPFEVASAGTHTVFTRGGVDTGTNFGQLRKALFDITSFDFSNIVNDRDSYNTDPVLSGTILGARVWTFGQTDAPSTRKIALTVESSATDDLSADIDVNNGYAMQSRDASADPATGNVWASLAAFNAAKWGYKITV